MEDSYDYLMQRQILLKLQYSPEVETNISCSLLDIKKVQLFENDLTMNYGDRQTDIFRDSFSINSAY
jgi:hypothetical protein